MTTNQISKTNQSSKLPASRRIFLSGFLGNISLAWKMALMAFVLFLGTLGVAGAAYSGLQSLRYQLSNIYDFMLIPIVAISNADTALANAEISLNNLNELTSLSNATPAEIEKNMEEIEVNEEVAYVTITRYANEWVTTVSPEFTQQLRTAGRLDLQEQEVIALENLTTALDEYETLQEEYYKSIEARRPDESQENAVAEKLTVARQHLQKLIEINNQFADISNQQAQAAYRQALLTGGVVLSIGLALGLLMSYLIVVSITGRLGDLTRSAAAMQEGNLEQAVLVTGRDEVGLLGKTFNTMAEQLKSLFDTLEQRVAERTSSLVLAAEVSRSVSQVRALDVMLKDATEIIRSRFDLYYAQVYLTNPAQNALNLQAGTGTVGEELVGRGHRLPLNTASINGRAAVEKHSVVISDTAASTTFRPNPLLPDTKSEIAVPLMVGEKVVGVLDLQSRQANALNQDSLTGFEALAGQLAIAIQNANLLAETEQARAEVEAQARRLVRKNWEEHLDAIHQPEQTGFVFEGNKVIPLADAAGIQPPTNGNSIQAPIAITGEPLGMLAVEMDAQALTPQNTELVNIIAHQVAQQIENLRLLESAERYRSEAEQAARRTTIEGWKEYMESRTGESLSYLYDTKEVRQYKEIQASDESSMTLPIKAREETVGKLAVEGIEPGDKDSFSLANAVAERLGAHIENLRLFEETKRGQIELDNRAHQLAAVAEISSVSAKELDIQKMLSAVVYMTQRKFGLYHAHVFTYNENMAELKIAACGWKEGDEHEGTHGTAVIPLAQEQSLVARAARTKQAVIVNDVHIEPGWLPNPLLPDTASEMAVPLMIGDELLGVLDVQSDRLNAFSDEDANIQTTLASQVATALQNAGSFAKAHQQAEREATLNVIGQKIQSATTVEAVLQIAARELGRALGAPLTIAQLGIKENNGNGGNHR